MRLNCKQVVEVEICPLKIYKWKDEKFDLSSYLLHFIQDNFAIKIINKAVNSKN